MSTVSSAPAAARNGSGPTLAWGLAKRWWGAWIARRIERAIIAQLCSMSDRELKDIGLTRTGIPGALREAARDRAFDRHHGATEAVS